MSLSLKKVVSSIIILKRFSSCIVIMPSKTRRKHTYNQQHYGENRDKILTERKEAYDTNSESKKAELLRRRLMRKILSLRNWCQRLQQSRLMTKTQWLKN